MKYPTPEDIKIALDYGHFLAAQNCRPEQRMIVDLTTEVQRLRSALEAANCRDNIADAIAFGKGL
ncbi:hypothetical protein OpiT1DRAFT_04743 [Opitutaceae bacterium TAV1]|nr:hypothetical protein OpiT1DRAFT_04743 [Opitutaceae bacterium TAV1]